LNEEFDMPRKNIVINLDRKKGKARGDQGANPAFVARIRKKGDPPIPGCGRPKGAVGAKKISEAYARHLEDKVPEDIATDLDIPLNSTWADAIAYQQLRQAIVRPANDVVNQEAVTELREVTEGKLADKSEFSGRDGVPLPSQLPPVNFHFIEPKKKDETTDQ
jgi:hypothetical protein